MKTKPFLLATAGSTVDGRVIDDKMIDEMASSYDPQTYGARVNIEHLRGLSGQAPFHAYGDVMELSVGEVDVNFNGETEKRKALYGVLDVSDNAKQLNDAGQKVYPSIEIEPNFGGKNFAYLMGVALTDSPAAIATEKMKFNRSLPGTIQLSRGSDGQPEGALPLEFADESEGGEAGKSLLAGLDSLFGKYFKSDKPEGDAPPQKAPEPKKPGGDAPQGFSANDLKPLFEGLGQEFSSAITGLRTEFREEMDQLSVKVKAVEKTVEQTPDTNHSARPQAAGGHGKFAKTNC